MKKLIAAAAGIDGKAFDYGNDMFYFSNLLDEELKKHCPQPQQ